MRRLIEERFGPLPPPAPGTAVPPSRRLVMLPAGDRVILTRSDDPPPDALVALPDVPSIVGAVVDALSPWWVASDVPYAFLRHPRVDALCRALRTVQAIAGDPAQAAQVAAEVCRDAVWTWHRQDTAADADADFIADVRSHLT